MSKPRDVLDHEIDVGDIIIAHMCSNDHPVVKGMAYKVNSIISGNEIEIAQDSAHLKVYSTYFIKVTGGLDAIIWDLDTIATRIQFLINSKPRSPLKEEIIAALKGAS